MFGQRSLHSFTLVYHALPRAFCSSNVKGKVAGDPSRPRNPLDILAARLDTRIRSKFMCTIDFARSILRPFAYRLGRQATLIRVWVQFVMLSSSNKP
ncbi:hypothetical protein QYF36_006527 [Acer negundo]|nr:hypothetical protein QYF36_006527 [Acer negundo]